MRAETSEGFNGVLAIVLDHAAASALLTCDTRNSKEKITSTLSLIDQGHTVVIWSRSADDRKLKFDRGGKRTVASRLADLLKKTMQ